MRCLLVFDHINDIIYTKYSKTFAAHINEFAKAQGLISEDDEDNAKSRINSDVIVQIFSPIVTSQRIMSCQFGNSYTSIQCYKGLNVTFEEYMGYLFICLANDDVLSMKRFISTCITVVRFLCGPDVLQLKLKPHLSSLVTNLIDTWAHLQGNDQAVFVEAVEQLLVNSDISSKVVQTLMEAANKLQSATQCNKLHMLLFVQNKFLGLYSSQNANMLSSTDILFSLILSSVHATKYTCQSQEDLLYQDSDDEEFYSPSASPTIASNSNLSVEDPSEIHSYQVLLAGADYLPKCIPHIIHVCPLSDGVNLVQFLEIGKENVVSSLYETFSNLHTMQTVQVQGNNETLKPAFDMLDNSMKRLCDGLKKVKNNSAIEAAYKQLSKQWDFIRRKYQDFIKNQSQDSLLRAETSTSILLENLKEVLQLTSYNDNMLIETRSAAVVVAKFVKEKLEYYNDFFKAKSFCNFSLGSDSLTVNKYLEEFPGLVHFLYIDRIHHRLTTPTIDFSSEETVALTKKKIWSMVNFARLHLQEGHLSIMWKDATFNYTYFLWFEDVSGVPLKPTVFPRHCTKALPLPGIFCGDFYQKLCEYCFPKTPLTKIRCYELFCVHLGLVTASCVLEHTRRLAATIWELKGHPNHPIDLL